MASANPPESQSIPETIPETLPANTPSQCNVHLPGIVVFTDDGRQLYFDDWSLVVCIAKTNPHIRRIIYAWKGVHYQLERKPNIGWHLCQMVTLLFKDEDGIPANGSYVRSGYSLDSLEVNGLRKLWNKDLFHCSHGIVTNSVLQTYQKYPPFNTGAIPLTPWKITKFDLLESDIVSQADVHEEESALREIKRNPRLKDLTLPAC